MPTHPAAPAPWIQRFAATLPAHSHVLDLACGTGRHTRLLLDRGHHVTAVDRDLSGVRDLEANPRISLHAIDLEREVWPFTHGRFDSVVVCNYLHRPLLSFIAQAVTPGGILLYSTFARGNEQFGPPRNPDFLLQDNELLFFASAGFTVHAFEHGHVDTPRPALRQSLYAIRQGQSQI